MCHANICRSPLAEGIFRHLVIGRGLTERFDIDSAGTWAPDGAKAHEHSVAVAAETVASAFDIAPLAVDGPEQPVDRPFPGFDKITPWCGHGRNPQIAGLVAKGMATWKCPRRCINSGTLCPLSASWSRRKAISATPQ